MKVKVLIIHMKNKHSKLLSNPNWKLLIFSYQRLAISNDNNEHRSVYSSKINGSFYIKKDLFFCRTNTNFIYSEGEQINYELF